MGRYDYAIYVALFSYRVQNNVHQCGGVGLSQLDDSRAGGALGMHGDMVTDINTQFKFLQQQSSVRFVVLRNLWDCLRIHARESERRTDQVEIRFLLSHALYREYNLYDGVDMQSG